MNPFKFKPWRNPVPEKKICSICYKTQIGCTWCEDCDSVISTCKECRVFHYLTKCSEGSYSVCVYPEEPIFEQL